MQNHDIVAQWLQFAEDDLRTAKYLLGLYPRPLEFFMPGGETEVSFCSIISRGKPKKLRLEKSIRPREDSPTL